MAKSSKHTPMPSIKWSSVKPLRRLIFFLLSLSPLACNRSFRPTVTTGFEGKPLPAFDILLPDSSTVLNTSDLPKGSPIVFIYFSPNCPYSQAEMNNIIKDMSKLKSITFCMFTTWPFQQLKGFVSYYELNKYSNIFVGEDAGMFISNHFKPVGVPFTMIYNKDRRLKYAFVGTMPGRQIEEVAMNN